MTIRPTKVKALHDYRIWIEFEDGESGEIDLAEFAGIGVFKAWEDRDFFEDVRIAPYESISWGEELDLCAVDLYMRLTGRTIDDVRQQVIHA
ncbi:MAG: DUF2442 domain-containing protein [Chloroflexi bacterium]|nr:DUF2442 domain-containing protein [Chloroflexota bacterium]